MTGTLGSGVIRLKLGVRFVFMYVKKLSIILRLPNAPSMKIYCVYGHGKETERSYW